MAEKKNLRKALRDMSIGETMQVCREDYRPSSVRSSAYSVSADYNRIFTVVKTAYGVEVKRVS